MRALETKDPSHPYYLRPNAIPWTSVAPAIIFIKDKPVMVVGSPGSQRIYSTVSQFLTNIFVKGMPMDAAMRHPRFHCSLAGKISLEMERFDPGISEYLRNLGYSLDPREAFDFFFGSIHAVMRGIESNKFYGVSEIRRDGTAEGL